MIGNREQASDFQVFDRRAVRRQRERAAPGFAAHGFLVDEIADRLSERLAEINRPFPRVLDLGAHDGRWSARLGERNPELLVATDLAANFLHGGAGLKVQADEEFLPFGAETFNLVTSALSLHWVNDLPGALIQIRQSLRPDGLFLAALLGGDTLTELRQAFLEAEAAVEGGVSPRVSPFIDVRLAGDLLQRTGFALPVVDSDTITVTYADAFALMREVKGMGEANAQSERRRSFTRRRTVLAAAEAYHARFGQADGRIPATFQVIYLTGWAPHESQQKPLRPGSATARLADALGVKEQPTGEKPSR